VIDLEMLARRRRRSVGRCDRDRLSATHADVDIAGIAVHALRLTYAVGSGLIGFSTLRPRSPELFRLLYSHSAQPNRVSRRRAGQFYTPFFKADRVWIYAENGELPFRLQYVHGLLW